MVSAGEKDDSKVDREVEGDCLLRILDRSFRRMRRGMKAGKDGSHDSGT